MTKEPKNPRHPIAVAAGFGIEDISLVRLIGLSGPVVRLTHAPGVEGELLCRDITVQMIEVLLRVRDAALEVALTGRDCKALCAALGVPIVRAESESPTPVEKEPA